MTSRNRRISLLASNLDANGDILQGAVAPSVDLGAGVTIYDSAGLLPDGASAGDQAFVTSNQNLYIHNGSGWYSVALINATPVITSVVDSDGGVTPFNLATDGTTLLNITITATDSDGDTLTYSATPDSDFTQYIGTVTNSGNVFTIDPFSSDSSVGGTGTIVFKATDDVNIGQSAPQSFVLIFVSQFWKDVVLSIDTGSDEAYSYRYIKWNILDNKNDASYTEVGEFELYDGSGSKITISSASGPDYGGKTPSFLLDGLFGANNKWVTTGNTAEVVFDLGSQQSIKSYRWGTGNLTENRDPTVWTIEGSNDNSTWTVLSTVSGYVSTASRDTFNPKLAIGSAFNNTSFIDRSTNALAVTPTGSPVQTAFHPYLDNWSVEFDGSGDTLNTSSDADFNLSSADWTIEGWTYGITDNANERIFALEGSSVSYALIRPSTGTGQLQWNHVGTAALITSSSGTAPANEWVHFALVSNSGTITLYVNGTSAGTTTTYPENSNTQLTIAGSLLRYVNTSTNAYISNFRVVKGTAVYTADFTPPTEKLTAISGTSLLTCQSNRFIDNSTNVHAITVNGNPKISSYNPFGQESEYAAGENKGSVDLDGDYLTLSSSDVGNFGVADYTVQFWIYKRGTTNDCILDLRGGDFSHGVSVEMDTKVTVFYGGTPFQDTGSFNNYAWNHIAICRSSGTLKGFINGSQIFSVSDTNNRNNTNNTSKIGVNYSNAQPTDALLSDIKVTHTAEYTSAFTPPTSPLGNTNAKLYLPMDNAGIFDKTGNFLLELEGDASTSTTQAKFGLTAMYFDGTGDYVTIPDDDRLDFHADFTLEMWVYSTGTATSGNQTIIGGNGSGSNGWAIYSTQGSETVNFFHSAFRITSSAGDLPRNQWVHLAVSRSGSITKMFVDGTQVGTEYTGSETFEQSSANAGTRIGYDIGANGYFTGYIDNLQILNGAAKYTANFTAPTVEQGRLYQTGS